MTLQNGRERLAVAGMALIVLIASVLLHEGLGHGGACVALGGKAVAWGAFYFDCAPIGAVADRLVAAAGSTVNLVAALVGLMVFGAAKRTPQRLISWLFFAVNWFQWAGYFAFSGFAGIGDWGSDGVLKGVSGAGLWRALEAVGGAGLYYLGGVIAARRLEAITGGAPERIVLARQLSWTAYLAGGAVALLIGLLNPVGLFIVLASAVASTFGGASGLMWLVERMPRSERAPAMDALNPGPWLVAGLVVAAAYAAMLGRSISF